MSHDEEINTLKKLFDDDQPSELDKHKWKVTLREKKRFNKKSFFWLQITTAASIGFIIGGIIFSGLNFKSEIHEENFVNDATIETVYTKL